LVASVQRQDAHRLEALVTALHPYSTVPLLVLFTLSAPCLATLNALSGEARATALATLQERAGERLLTALGVSGLERVRCWRVEPLLATPLADGAADLSKAGALRPLREASLVRGLEWLARESAAPPTLHTLTLQSLLHAAVTAALEGLVTSTDTVEVRTHIHMHMHAHTLTHTHI
jgi:hypothetical protein